MNVPFWHRNQIGLLVVGLVLIVAVGISFRGHAFRKLVNIVRVLCRVIFLATKALILIIVELITFFKLLHLP
jgi:hypothetical protein